MIKHLYTYNARGEPQYYYTLTEEEIAEWRKAQTPEQLRLTRWLEERQTWQ